MAPADRRRSEDPVTNRGRGWERDGFGVGQGIPVDILSVEDAGGGKTQGIGFLFITFPAPPVQSVNPWHNNRHRTRDPDEQRVPSCAKTLVPCVI